MKKSITKIEKNKMYSLDFLIKVVANKIQFQNLITLSINQNIARDPVA